LGTLSLSTSEIGLAKPGFCILGINHISVSLIKEQLNNGCKNDPVDNFEQKEEENN